LLHNRYGFVPDKEKGLFITQMEYQHAVNKKIPARVYLNSDSSKAKKHAEIAKERASCGYIPALKKAQGILNKINKT